MIGKNQVATVDAVEGVDIDATLSLTARGTAIVGNHVVIRVHSDVILGRIASVSLTNPIHKDSTFASYIMTNGAVPEWSGDVDIERAKVNVIRVIDQTTKKQIPMRRCPPSGTAVSSITEGELNEFRNDADQFCVVGKIPNSEGMKISVINRHFGEIKAGGYGEARHMLIFGQNGSGKSVWATTLLAGRLAAHKDMGLLMPDTHGDLSNPAGHSSGDFKWNYQEVLEKAGVEVRIIDVDDIRLNSIPLLKHLLTPFFHTHLSMDNEKAATLSGRVANAMFDREVDSSALTDENIIEQLREHLEWVYAKASRKDRSEDLNHLATTPGRRRPFAAGLERIRKFFDGRERIDELIKGILLRGWKIVIKMNSIGELDQEQVLRELMSKLIRQAQMLYKSGQMRLANAIVMLDEGQQWVPQTGSMADEHDDVRSIIRRAIRETRKYGIGWWVIAQRPTAIHNDVISQAHTVWFGRNLGTGADSKHLEDRLKKIGAEEYNRLSLQGGYFWMAIGQDNNIGSENLYFSIHPFDGDATQAFIEANPHIFSAV